MEPLPGARSRGTRLALVTGGLFVLLVIVAFASRSGFGAKSDAPPSQAYLNWAFSIFFVLFVLAIPVAAYAWLMQKREAAAQGKLRRRPWFQTIAIVLFFVMLTVLVKGLHDRRGQGLFQKMKPPTDALGGKKRTGTGAQHLEPHFQWPVLVIILVLLAAGVAAYVVARKRKGRREHGDVADLTLNADLSDAISDAIDDLEAEPDARRAVIAAYARMEGILGRHGLRRRPSETPLEYLARVLLDLRAEEGSVRRLTSLFERAKFSRHEVDLQMKREAIAALGSIRDDLRGAVA